MCWLWVHMFPKAWPVLLCMQTILFLRDEASSRKGGEAAESDELLFGCFRANYGGSPGTALYKLDPPHCSFNVLESTTANMGAVPSWHQGWHRFRWHGDGLLLKKEAFSLSWPKKSCCTSHARASFCATLCNIVSVCETRTSEIIIACSISIFQKNKGITTTGIKWFHLFSL